MPGVRGRRSIFRDKPKDRKNRYQGLVSNRGRVKLEEARVRLAQLARCEVAVVSDGDVMEFLARGEAETRKYLKSLAEEG